MTLDEAIEHAEEVVEEKRYEYQECLAVHDMEDAMDCKKCGEEHRQLAEWLKDYKRLKEQEPCDDAISRQAAQAKIKSICDEYRLSYEDGERKASTGGSAYALGHAFNNLPPVTTPQPKTGHWNYTRYINALRACVKEHKDDVIPFAHIKVSELCSDVADLLERLEQEPAHDKTRVEIINATTEELEAELERRRKND